MGTFNAGTIEADLTLDRSPFQRHLDEARAQAQKFDNTKIEPELDIDTAGAFEQLELFEREAKRIDGQDIDIQVDVDTTLAFAQLALLEAIHDRLDGNDINMDVDAGGLSQAAGHFTRFEALVTAVLLLLPLVPPVAATATAALIGLASAFTAAAGGLAVIGIGIAPMVKHFFELNSELDKQKTRLATLKPGTKEYAKQQEKIQNLQKVINEQFGPASKGFDLMRDAWSKFQDAIQPQAIKLVGDFFEMLAAIIPVLTPIFHQVAPILSGIFDGITAFAKSSEMRDVISFFGEFGGKALQQIIDIGGNVLEFLFHLFEAFAPFATTMLDGIADVTQAWADWADQLEGSKGFQDFLDYVAEVGPKVWDLVTNIVEALINLGIALAPVGNLFLDAFNWFFDFIANMDPTILGAIAVGLGSIVAAVLLLSAAMAILSISPWILLAGAIIGVIGAIVYLWNTNEGFRTAIINAWNAIWAFFEGIVNWFTGTLVPAFQTAWNGIVAGAMWVWGQVGPIFMGIKDVIVLAWQIVVQVVQFTMNQIMFIVNAVGPPLMAFWNNIKGFLQAVWYVILAIATNVWNSIKTTIQVVMQAIWAVIKFVWEQIRNAILTVLNVIKGILQATLSLMKGDVNGAMNAIKGIFVSIWNGIKNSVSITINAILSVIGSTLANIQRTVSTIFAAIVRVISTNLQAAKTNVVNIVNGIRSFFGGAGTWLINAGRSLISGLIEGIKQMFGQAIQTARNLLGTLRDLLPFSPAKTGPFSGQGWTLYSGRALVKGLIEGVKDQRFALKQAGEDLLNQLPTQADLTANLVVGRGGLSIADLAGGARQQTITVSLVANNPVKERSSETATRELTRLAQLGVFS